MNCPHKFEPVFKRIWYMPWVKEKWIWDRCVWCNQLAHRNVDGTYTLKIN